MSLSPSEDIHCTLTVTSNVKAVSAKAYLLSMRIRMKKNENHYSLGHFYGTISTSTLSTVTLRTQ